MKIYEIISESNQVDEGIVSNIANWAAKSTATKSAIPAIAEKWAEKIMNAQVHGRKLELNTAQLKKLAPPEARRYLSDPKYVKEIEQQAAKIVRQKNFSNIKGALGMSTAPISKWSLTKAIGSAGVTVFNTWQITKFFTDYNSNVNAWDAELKKQLAAGKITQEQYQAQLAHIRKTEMGLLITKVGAGLLGSVIVRGTLAPFAWGLKKFSLTAPIGSLISGLGAAGSAYLYSKLNSKEGSEAVATIMVGNALGDTVTATLGNAGTSALDWLTGTAEEAKKLDQQPAQGGQGASQTPVNAPGQQPAKPAAQPAAAPTAPTMPGNNKTATADLYTPAGYTRDAAGNLIYGN
jgi:hypothetical protein